jgi:hypothetical protein
MPGNPQFCRKQARRCADMWAVTKNPELRKSLEDLDVNRSILYPFFNVGSVSYTRGTPKRAWYTVKKLALMSISDTASPLMVISSRFFSDCCW